MKLLLVDFNRDVFAHGVRHLAAFLRNKGIGVSVAFLPGDKDSMFGEASQEQLGSLLRLAQQHEVVGLSLLSHHALPRAKQVSQFLKFNTNLPIIWGGVPIICDPQQFFNYSDYVCLGEGEYFFLQMFEHLAKGDSFLGIQNLGYKKPDESIQLNQLAPFCDLQAYPPCTFDFDNFYLIKDRAVSFREDPNILVKDSASRGYTLFTVRGCPFSCSYCCNNSLKNNLRSCGAPIRKHNVENVIRELECAKNQIKSLGEIKFDDDDFFIRSEAEISEFSEKYKERIDIPFWINASMWNINSTKLDIMEKYELNLRGIKIGLQSGSASTNKNIYGRNFNRNKFMEGLRTLHDRNISVIMDTISGNPFESVEERRKTALFLADCLDSIYMDGPNDNGKIIVLDHKLMFYPGTELYQKALDDNLITPDHVEEVLCKSSSHAHRDDPYATIGVDWLITKLFNNHNSRLPVSKILRMLSNKNVYRFADTSISKSLMKIPVRAVKLKRAFLESVRFSVVNCHL